MNNPYSKAPDEQAGEFFRLALAFLSKHKIAPTPVNYQLAYDYVSGKNKQLKTLLDEHIGVSETVSPENLWHVYQQFYQQDIATLENTRQELRQLIAIFRTNLNVLAAQLPVIQIDWICLPQCSIQNQVKKR